MMLLDVWPTRAQFHPQDTVGVWVSVSGVEPGTLPIVGRVFCGGEEVTRFDHQLEIGGDGVGGAEVSVTLPPVGLADGGTVGYAVEVTAACTETQVRATTAFDVAGHWSAAPRYGFFADFAPDEPPVESERRADDLLKLHVNVVQFYDWMASHHSFLPATEEFTDPLGRRLSHAVVRRKVDLVHRRGMSALAYGALYGAEEDFSGEHPEWLLYDGAEQPLKLADVFYLQDFSEGSGWRAWILDQYRQAVVELDFDGIHIDQYGFPKRALSRASGSWREVDVADEFPGFVEEAASMLLGIRPEGGSIFNCVNAWPVDEMVRAGADAATYVEVWEPNSTYRDLYEVVRQARRLRPEKQVILAAYLRPFHPVDGRTAGALRAFRLASAVINASGGFHLIAGEGDGLLTEAYYPNYGRLEPSEFAVLRSYSDFIVRNTAILHGASGPDIAWTHVGPTNEVILLNHSELDSYGAGARLDSLWVTGRDSNDVVSLQLVNLRGLESDEWNTGHPEPPRPLEDIEVRVRLTGDIDGVWWDTPDDDIGIARPIPFEVVDEDAGRFLMFRIPRVVSWSAVWWRRSGWSR
ncbi:MAG: hypothetical protein GWP04_06320 [Gammaproteobacteria bacterium]|nr:hypothetical protein [Gammaproteobacteria bacterium]